MRKVIKHLIILCVGFVIATILILFTAALCLEFIVGWMDIILGDGYNPWLFSSEGSFIFITVVIVCGLNGWAINEVRCRLPDRKKKVKTEGILSSYLKAKKEKICPLIEYED